MKRVTPAPKNETRQIDCKTLIPALLFLMVIVLTVFTTWNATLYCLDGDASAELILAKHLNETGRILSSDWYYSTELRVLNTQLVFAPLFSVFSDWHLVRFTGAMILQAMLVLSFFYLGRQANLRAGALFLGGSLLLLPICVTYGRNVLYQTFYMPHIILGFLIVGLFLSVQSHLAAARKMRSALCFALLIILSFGTGLGGLRQIIITHAPLMLLLIVLFYQDAKDRPVAEILRAHLPGILIAAFAVAAFMAGYLVNIRYLLNRYIFAEYHNLTTSLPNTEELGDILFGFLHSFGYRRDIRILSALGILSASAVFSSACCLARGIHLLKCADADAKAQRRLIAIFPVCSLFIMLCVFLFINNGWFYILYLIPVTVWFIPMIAAHYDAMPENFALLRRADVCMLLCTMLLAGNGLANLAYFATNGESFAQDYEGQYFSDIQLARKLEKPVAYLLENGYELGYANFWSASPVTEISDGKIKMINLLVNEHNRELVVHEWLMLQSTFDMEPEKTFLLLSAYHDRAYATMKFDYKGERVYDDGEYVIYHFDDSSILKDYTSWEFSTR